LAYYNERASKQCVRCYGSKTNPCHGCDGGKKQNKSRCSYCDGKTTVRYANLLVILCFIWLGGS
jgi:hypothetical protein